MRSRGPVGDGRPVLRTVVTALLVLALGGCGQRAPRTDPAPGPTTAATRSTGTPSGDGEFAVLVFTRTTGFRHASIDDGVAAIRRLGAANGFAVDATEDPGQIRETVLGRYRAVVFLSTTGEPLGPAEQAALERWVEGGGGWVGIHAAADAHDDWSWYGELVGARFRRHPKVQPATVRVTDRGHRSTRTLPAAWDRTDEWYDFRTNPRGRARVLAVVEESSYQGGGMGADHPVSWYHPQGRGRAWYTALGHTREGWAERPFLAHVLGGIQWAAGAD